MLVAFVFSAESRRKLQPAVVLTSTAYHRARQEVIVAAITSNVRRRLFGDHILAEIKRSMIDRKLGTMAKADLEAFDRQLRRSLGPR